MGLSCCWSAGLQHGQNFVRDRCLPAGSVDHAGSGRCWRAQSGLQRAPLTAAKPLLRAAAMREGALSWQHRVVACLSYSYRLWESRPGGLRRLG